MQLKVGLPFLGSEPLFLSAHELLSRERGSRGTGAADRAALLHTSSKWCLVALTSGATRESSGARRILRATVDARSSACTNSDSLLTTRAVRHDRTTYQHLAYYSRCARVPLEVVGWSPLHARFYHPLFGPPHAIFALAIIAR